MQISKETLVLLRNFSSINSSILLPEGSLVKTISEGNNVMAEAEIQETIPVQFGIYDLNEFLSIISIFKEQPEFEFSEKFVMISDGSSNKIKYYAASPEIIKSPPSTIRFPDPEIVFDLEQSSFDTLKKVSSTLKTSDVSIIGDNGELKIVVVDKKNPTGNSFESVVGETKHTFRSNFKIENIKFLSGNYQVNLSSKKISKFVNKEIDLKYFVAVEADSSFDV
jgi:hypothetical protein